MEKETAPKEITVESSQDSLITVQEDIQEASPPAKRNDPKQLTFEDWRTSGRSFVFMGQLCQTCEQMKAMLERAQTVMKRFKESEEVSPPDGITIDDGSTLAQKQGEEPYQGENIDGERSTGAFNNSSRSRWVRIPLKRVTQLLVTN